MRAILLGAVAAQAGDLLWPALGAIAYVATRATHDAQRAAITAAIAEG